MSDWVREPNHIACVIQWAFATLFQENADLLWLGCILLYLHNGPEGIEVEEPVVQEDDKSNKEAYSTL